LSSRKPGTMLAVETIKEISKKEKLLYNKTQNELSAKYEKIKAAIEAKAVMIGL
jgi:hypothetical protein